MDMYLSQIYKEEETTTLAKKLIKNWRIQVSKSEKSIF